MRSIIVTIFFLVICLEGCTRGLEVNTYLNKAGNTAYSLSEGGVVYLTLEDGGCGEVELIVKNGVLENDGPFPGEGEVIATGGAGILIVTADTEEATIRRIRFLMEAIRKEENCK